MLFRFLTSIAGPHCAFMEGQTVEVPNPQAAPEFLQWLQAGVVAAVKDDPSELALPPEAVERAIVRRTGLRGRRRRSPMSASASTPDDTPSVPALCPGGTVVCLASGESLTAEDVAYCRGRADAVIAVNDAHRLAPWATALYSSDVGWYTHYQGVPAFPGLKFGIVPLAPPAAWGITVLQNTGDRGIDARPTGLRTGRNSGAAAINLAVHFGASRIVLLGYDMKKGATGKTHFFGEHPQPIRHESPYDAFLEVFKTTRAPLAQLGVSVINCTPGSALTVFPCQPLREVLACQPLAEALS